MDRSDHPDKHLVEEPARVTGETVREELREQTRKQRRKAMLHAASRPTPEGDNVVGGQAAATSTPSSRATGRDDIEVPISGSSGGNLVWDKAKVKTLVEQLKNDETVT
ncbi:hypothetical protein AB0P31_39720, partial [Streptomyces sp. NPDC088357]